MTRAPEAPASINYSVVPATVTNTDDTLGRVKVRYPWMDERGESDWLAVAAVGAGRDRGLFWIPVKDDLVLVAFSFGQLDKGYVIGSLWSTADKPPSAGDPQKRTLKSPGGHVITLDDTGGSELISIVDKAGSKIVVDSKNKTVTIESLGDLAIKASGVLALTGDQGVTVNGKTIALEARTDLSAKGTSIALNGPAGVKINDGALEVV